MNQQNDTKLKVQIQKTVILGSSTSITNYSAEYRKGRCRNCKQSSEKWRNIFWDDFISLFFSRAPEHYHIVSKDGNCRKYISLCQRKNPNKFSLHSIEKPNDTQGSFGAIWRIPLTKSFSSSIRIKTNSKDEDIQVPMCTNWTPPEWSYTCSGLFQ